MEKSNIKSFPKKNSEDKKNHIDSLSPREIVSELDRYVVGQNKAKRAPQHKELFCVFVRTRICKPHPART